MKKLRNCDDFYVIRPIVPRKLRDYIKLKTNEGLFIIVTGRIGTGLGLDDFSFLGKFASVYDVYATIGHKRV